MSGYGPRDASVDADHLRTLTVCHWIWAGFRALTGCGVGTALIFVGGAVGKMLESMPTPPGGTPPPPAFFKIIGGMYAAIGVFILAWDLTLAVLNAVAARSLAQRRSRRFCFVIAVLNCLSLPLGTVLGVFTLVVLGRPSVIEAFDRLPDDPAAPPN